MPLRRWRRWARRRRCGGGGAAAAAGGRASGSRAEGRRSRSCCCRGPRPATRRSTTTGGGGRNRHRLRRCRHFGCSWRWSDGGGSAPGIRWRVRHRRRHRPSWPVASAAPHLVPAGRTIPSRAWCAYCITAPLLRSSALLLYWPAYLNADGRPAGRYAKIWGSGVILGGGGYFHSLSEHVFPFPCSPRL